MDYYIRNWSTYHKRKSPSYLGKWCSVLVSFVKSTSITLKLIIMAQIRINLTFIWNNGIEKEAIYLNAESIQDNLETEARFYYTLLDENYTTLITGNISIVADDYIQWLANDFSTNWIMNWIAAQLNLTPTPII